ncbi:MAG: DUF4357 domain-containing protein [Clostridia bacterium]|nr:DUF4357 domain-containing protein [Clostridia bacterium]
MAKGVLYCMTTVVSGLIKIGKTTADSFESRMYNLERHGYCNVTGLKRHFAIEVEDYDEKETLLDDIFSKSRVPNSELFALDIDLVVQLLSSFDGKQIYPQNESKEEVFRSAATERAIRADWDKVPDGKYYLHRVKRGFGRIEATMRVEGGLFIVEKGSVCAPVTGRVVPEVRANAVIRNNVLQEDVACTSPSNAGWVVIGAENDGWREWKNEEGQPIDIYRTHAQ